MSYSEAKGPAYIAAIDSSQKSAPPQDFIDKYDHEHTENTQGVSGGRKGMLYVLYH